MSKAIESSGTSKDNKTPQICDKDVQLWHEILEPEKLYDKDLDWHSSKTFELFLEALDINQKPVDERHFTKRTSNVIKHEPNQVTTKANGTNKGDECCRASRQGLDETILSAEALKILSDLPDLSQMSATRSFIFPNSSA